VVGHSDFPSKKRAQGCQSGRESRRRNLCFGGWRDLSRVESDFHANDNELMVHRPSKFAALASDPADLPKVPVTL